MSTPNLPDVVIVPNWVAEIADRYVEDIAEGCPVSVAIERAVMEALQTQAERPRSTPATDRLGGAS